VSPYEQAGVTPDIIGNNPGQTGAVPLGVGKYSHRGRDNVKTSILTYCLRATFDGQGEVRVISIN